MSDSDASDRQRIDWINSDLEQLKSAVNALENTLRELSAQVDVLWKKS